MLFLKWYWGLILGQIGSRPLRACGGMLGCFTMINSKLLCRPTLAYRSRRYLRMLCCDLKLVLLKPHDGCPLLRDILWFPLGDCATVGFPSGLVLALPWGLVWFPWGIVPTCFPLRYWAGLYNDCFPLGDCMSGFLEGLYVETFG